MLCGVRLSGAVGAGGVGVCAEASTGVSKVNLAAFTCELQMWE